MPMRGLLKRDDPKLQASVSSKYQVLLGRRAAAWRRMPQELRRRWGSCRCACMCAMRLSQRLLVAVEPQHASRRSFVVDASIIHPLSYRSRAHPRPPLLASSSCFPRPQLGLLALRKKSFKRACGVSDPRIYVLLVSILGYPGGYSQHNTPNKW